MMTDLFGVDLEVKCSKCDGWECPECDFKGIVLTPEGRDLMDFIHRHWREERKPRRKRSDAGKDRTPIAEVCRLTWEAYKSAFSQAYSTEPLRNAKVNSLIVQLVKRIGKETPEFVTFYVTEVKDSFYRQNLHDLSLCVRDAEKLYARWKGGAGPDSPNTAHVRSQLERIQRGTL